MNAFAYHHPALLVLGATVLAAILAALVTLIAARRREEASNTNPLTEAGVYAVVCGAITLLLALVGLPMLAFPYGEKEVTKLADALAEAEDRFYEQHGRYTDRILDLQEIDPELTPELAASDGLSFEINSSGQKYRIEIRDLEFAPDTVVEGDRGEEADVDVEG